MVKPTSPLISQSSVSLKPVGELKKTAALTLDLEADYGGNQFKGLSNIWRVIDVISSENVPLTVFVEGRVLEKYPSHIEEIAANPLIDVQLHCYDHRQKNENRRSLEKSVSLFSKLLGQPPEGYRAHTFQLTRELCMHLSDLNFKWDSSVLPAIFGYGANRARIWRSGNGAAFFIINNRLLEFPVATYRRIAVPLYHSYRVFLRRPICNWLARFAKLPEFLVYDMHLADLFRLGSPIPKTLPPSARLLYRLSWIGRKPDTLRELEALISMLKARGYSLLHLSTIYAEYKDRVFR